MTLSMSGLPVVVIGVGFLVVFSTPVWLAARMVGAEEATLGRAIFSLISGLIGAIISALFFGGFALILAPLSFILSFKLVLGTSFVGAIVLGILSVVGYALMIHFIGAAFSVDGSTTNV